MKIAQLEKLADFKSNRGHYLKFKRKYFIYYFNLDNKFSRLQINLLYTIFIVFKFNHKFRYDFENRIITFEKSINNNKDFENIKYLCYCKDCRFKLLNRNQIELIY